MASVKNGDENSHDGLTVAHSLNEFVDGQERILVLKDSTILENEGRVPLPVLPFFRDVCLS
jgi:hypothetical protein